MGHADPIDQSVAEQERALEYQLANAKLLRGKQLVDKGACYNCDEPLQSGLRFCDSDCRDDYEQRRKMRGV